MKKKSNEKDIRLAHDSWPCCLCSDRSLRQIHRKAQESSEKSGASVVDYSGSEGSVEGKCVLNAEGLESVTRYLAVLRLDE